MTKPNKRPSVKGKKRAGSRGAVPEHMPFAGASAESSRIAASAAAEGAQAFDGAEASGERVANGPSVPEPADASSSAGDGSAQASAAQEPVSALDGEGASAGHAPAARFDARVSDGVDGVPSAPLPPASDPDENASSVSAPTPPARRPRVGGKRVADARRKVRAAVDSGRVPDPMRIEEGPADDFDLGDARGGDAPRASVPSRIAGLFSSRRKGSEPRSPQEPAAARAAKPRVADVRAASAGAPARANAAASGPSQSQGASPAREERGRANAFEPGRSRKATTREKAIVRARKRKVALTAAAVTFLFIVAVSGALFWNAYLRYDDAADIQGEWQVEGTGVTVVVDADSIEMPDALSYAYTIDTWAKTIAFSFDDLSGSGSYRFSDDRRTLVITEGQGDAAVAMTMTKLSDDTTVEPRKDADSSDESDADDDAGDDAAAATGDAS